MAGRENGREKKTSGRQKVSETVVVPLEVPMKHCFGSRTVWYTPPSSILSKLRGLRGLIPATAAFSGALPLALAASGLPAGFPSPVTLFFFWLPSPPLLASVTQMH